MEQPPFVDGLGRRVPVAGTDGERLESLRLCTEMAEVPATEDALVERASSLARFEHPAFAPLRRIERATASSGLALVSVAAGGSRLSDLLRQAERHHVEPGVNAALFLLQQAVSAIAALHRHAADAAHGAIGPERIVVRPDSSVVVCEYVLGGALEQLQLPRSQFWSLFRVPVPASAGRARFDQQTDVLQLGLLAVALLLGRVLQRDEFPHRLQAVLDEAMSACGLGDPPPPAPADPRAERAGRGGRALRAWIGRALQFEARSTFRTAVEAEDALAAALAGDPSLRPSSDAVGGWMLRCAIEPPPVLDEATPRLKRSGAVVLVPPRPDVTTRLSPPAGSLDRGSAAHRVLSAGPESDTGPVRVLAELSRRMPAVRPAPDPEVRPLPQRVAGHWGALRRALHLGVVIVGLVVLWGATYLGARSYLRPDPPPATGTLVVESRPAGVEVTVDGQPGGRTPARLQLSPGQHTLTLHAGRGVTILPVTVMADKETVERVDLRRSRAAPRRSQPPK